jgi:hypothetical protein
MDLLMLVLVGGWGEGELLLVLALVLVPLLHTCHRNSKVLTNGLVRISQRWTLHHWFSSSGRSLQAMSGQQQSAVHSPPHSSPHHKSDLPAQPLMPWSSQKTPTHLLPCQETKVHEWMQR